MKNFERILAIALVASLGAAAFAAQSVTPQGAATQGAAAAVQPAQQPAAQPVAAQPAPAKETVWPADKITFTDVPAVKGVSKADLWGNAEKGEHGTLTKFAAGTTTPQHTHTY